MRFLICSLFSLSLFLSSLLSHGPIPYVISFALIFKISIINYFYDRPNFTIKGTLFIFCVLIVALCSGIYTLSDPFNTVIDKAKLAVPGNAAMLLFLVLFSILFRLSLSTNNRFNQLKVAIILCLMVHLSFFYVQFFAWYIFGVKIDFLLMLGGTEARLENYFADRSALDFLVFRASGLFVEPSTFVAAIIILITLASILEVPGVLINISIVSLLLSLSSVGILMFFILFSSSFLYNKKSKTYIFMILAILVLSFLLYDDFVIAFFDDVFRKIVGGSSFRLTLTKYYILHDSLGLNLFGYGYFGLPEGVEKLLNNSNAAINDVGLGLFTIMKFGLLPGIAFFALIFTRLSQPGQRIMFLCVLLSKAPLVFPLVISLYIVIFSYRRN